MSPESDTYEYVFVMEGKLEISVGEEDFVVQAGEFLQFQANCPHEYRCLGRKTASVIMQISYLQ